MARLRTPVEIVTIAMNVRTEGMGLRAAGRSLGKSHSTIIEWERRLAKKLSKWSPAAPIGAEVTIEGDEVYTRVGENRSPL
jgi:transposase